MNSLMDGMSARHRAHVARFFSRQAWARLRQSGQAAERVVAARRHDAQNLCPHEVVSIVPVSVCASRQIGHASS